MQRTVFIIALWFALLSLIFATPAPAEVISGTFTNWVDLNPYGFPLNPRYIGDDEHSVTGLWSLAESDDTDEHGPGPNPDGGWFYGRGITGGSDIPPDTEVARADGVTDISEITDASIYDFTDGTQDYYRGPGFDGEKDSEIGDFIVFRNIETGHYGALRIDDIYGCHYNPRLACRMEATWWFQTDGSANFSPCGAIIRGDSNGDAAVDFNDIDCFVAALIDQSSWRNCGGSAPAECYAVANDINRDTRVDFDDIAPFVECLVNNGCP